MSACQSVKDDPNLKTPEARLQMLSNKSFYFDFPLYIGLLGTIIGFLLISIFPTGINGGRTVSYSSTVIGILITTFIQKRVSEYRATLVRQNNERNRGEA